MAAAGQIQLTVVTPDLTWALEAPFSRLRQRHRVLQGERLARSAAAQPEFIR
jgi:hypothetical protein